MSPQSGITRRGALQTIGAGVAGVTLLGGVASADPQYPWDERNPNVEYVSGESQGGFSTFLARNRGGKPIAMGVSMTKAGYRALTGSHDPGYNLDLPALDGSNFTYAGINWNPFGHPPVGVWTIPHFDFHFYLMDEADVTAIPLALPYDANGAEAYSLPDAMVPRGYDYLLEDLGSGPSRVVIPAMGEHLAEVGDDTPPYTYIYGTWDPSIASIPGPVVGYLDFETGDFVPAGPGDAPDGSDAPAGYLPMFLVTTSDGESELTFCEPMITDAFFEGLMDGTEHDVVVPVNVPRAFPKAGWYPTAYGIRYDADAEMLYVTIEEFRRFPGYDTISSR